MLISHIDFAENGTYNMTRDEIQSAHWSNKSYTLFMMILVLLDEERWISKDSRLKEGDEVAVQKVDGSYEHIYGVVMKHNYETDDVEVAIPNNEYYHSPPTKITRQRKLLRHKVKQIVPVPGVSDDPNHDTAFVQTYIDQMLLDRSNGWLYTQSDVQTITPIHERIKCLVFVSDGAASHFKQRGTMYWLATTFFLREKDKNMRLIWLVGCPGHGKGIWDGLGGIIKNRIIKYILETNIVPENVYEVYLLIVELFGTEACKQSYAKKLSLKVKSWSVRWLPLSATTLRRTNAPADITEIKAAFVDGTYGSLKIFYYEPLLASNDTENGEGRIGYCRFGCFCDKCVLIKVRSNPNFPSACIAKDPGTVSHLKTVNTYASNCTICFKKPKNLPPHILPQVYLLRCDNCDNDGAGNNNRHTYCCNRGFDLTLLQNCKWWCQACAAKIQKQKKNSRSGTNNNIADYSIPNAVKLTIKGWSEKDTVQNYNIQLPAQLPRIVEEGTGIRVQLPTRH